jgi:hypothetical protein
MANFLRAWTLRQSLLENGAHDGEARIFRTIHDADELGPKIVGRGFHKIAHRRANDIGWQATGLLGSNAQAREQGWFVESSEKASWRPSDHQAKQ